MKINTILFIFIGILILGISFISFKYFDVVVWVNDMQSGIRYRDNQIKTLEKLFLSIRCEVDRTTIVDRLKKDFGESVIIKEFKNRIEVDGIVLVFHNNNIDEVMTLTEYDNSKR